MLCHVFAPYGFLKEKAPTIAPRTGKITARMSGRLEVWLFQKVYRGYQQRMRRKYIQSNTKPFAYCPEGRKIGTSLDRDHYVAVAGMPEQLLHEGSKESCRTGERRNNQTRLDFHQGDGVTKQRHKTISKTIFHLSPFAMEDGILS